MLNVGMIQEGFVLDHIQAGKSMDIYKYLHLDELDCCVAIIKNARSNKMGRKDIMKIECPIDFIDMNVLGFIDHNITINIIKDSEIVDKMALELPKEVVNVVNVKTQDVLPPSSRNWSRYLCSLIRARRLTDVNGVKKNTAADCVRKNSKQSGRS